MDSGAFSSAEKVVGTAKMFSALDSCTIWALIAMALIVYVYWSKKEELKSSEAWRGIREKQIASETAQTEVMKSLTQEIASMKLLLTKYLLKE